MRIKYKILFIILILSVTSNCSFSQTSKYSNEFLSLGVGARALGMANSYVVTANDATASYWNPSGLVQLSGDLQLTLMHSGYFAGILKYDYGTLAKRIDTSAVFAFSIIRLGVDGIPNTIDLIDSEGYIHYDNIEAFSVADHGFLFSYAKLLKKVSIGANAKVIYRKAGDFATAWGFGLDIGAQFKYNQWQFGAMVRDVTTTYNAWSYKLSDRTIEVLSITGNEIPKNSIEITLPKLILGIARNYIIRDKIHLLTELDLDITFDRKRNVLISSNPISLDPHFGIELNYNKIVFIRSGINNIQKVKAEIGNYKKTIIQPSLGVGVAIKGITVDYALSMLDLGGQSDALYTNIFSLKINMNNPKK